MNRRTARGNRIGLTLVGLLLVLLGVLGLVLWGTTPANQPILLTRMRDPMVWWGVAVVAAIMAILGLRWLLVQGRRATAGTLRLDSGPTGTTLVSSNGITQAVAADVAASPAVLRASANLGEAGEVRLNLVADEQAPMSQVLTQLSDVAIPRMRSTLETERVPAVAQVTLEPAKRRVS
ncbi:hypothetical protein [Nonomuraea sediminis]|uniref:hypothetical protein n=1 Tax=Nonomuraea sediminis TaxID=2835864 RepID=UPI001BDBB350|nr:hypothetical protein [Nonomuraea sediminis]